MGENTKTIFVRKYVRKKVKPLINQGLYSVLAVWTGTETIKYYNSQAATNTTAQPIKTLTIKDFSHTYKSN